MNLMPLQEKQINLLNKKPRFLPFCKHRDSNPGFLSGTHETPHFSKHALIESTLFNVYKNNSIQKQATFQSFHFSTF